MARYEYDKKDNWLRNLLIASGQTSQPSGKGRSRPIYGLPPIISNAFWDTRQQQRDKARYQASINRVKDRLTGLPILPTNEKERAARASVLAEALAPFGDDNSPSGSNEFDHLYSRKMIDEAGRSHDPRWDRYPDMLEKAAKASAIPMGSYAEPMTEYEMEPMAPRLDPFYADEDFRGTEAEEKEAASMWNKAFEDHDRKMQAEGRMTIGPDTVEERMEAREPGPLENAIIQSLASKKRKKK